MRNLDENRLKNKIYNRQNMAKYNKIIEKNKNKYKILLIKLIDIKIKRW